MLSRFAIDRGEVAGLQVDDLDVTVMNSMVNVSRCWLRPVNLTWTEFRTSRGRVVILSLPVGVDL